MDKNSQSCMHPHDVATPPMGGELVHFPGARRVRAPTIIPFPDLPAFARRILGAPP